MVRIYQKDCHFYTENWEDPCGKSFLSLNKQYGVDIVFVFNQLSCVPCMLVYGQPMSFDICYFLK